ncbi:MAG TPA: DUF6505 family protein [Xanthobacteraceae bacterium]|nr:DUF6505 family protein [Xanthobacteraceae bacterium]
MKLLRTIRLDASDTFVFDVPAEAGDWAVSGAFIFWDKDPANLEGKARAAFRSGFLGVKSLGWSTLAQVVEATEAERAALVDTLADQLIEHFGAPTIEAARAAAEEEIAFAESLCTIPQDSIIAVHRSFENDAVRETFRALRGREGAKPTRAFSFIETESDDEPSEQIDLIALGEREHK